jgi:hypothetical protein
MERPCCQSPTLKANAGQHSVHAHFSTNNIKNNKNEKSNFRRTSISISLYGVGMLLHENS